MSAAPGGAGPQHKRPATAGYKRSWKNLLINKSYQLKFTLFMVGLATVLMLGLGVWVMKVADETTEVSIASVRGTPCVIVPTILEDDEDVLDVGVPGALMKLDDPAVVAPGSVAPVVAPVAAAAAADDADDSADPDAEPHHRSVVMTESTIRMVAPAPKPPRVAPPDYGAKLASHLACVAGMTNAIDRLEDGRLRILYVMIATGLLLVMGLAMYGIKMTHKVAGPLFKVGLYLSKMKGGRFDKVWNLRKGDQLVEFYDHFRHAHAGIVQMQKDDIAKLKAVIAAAESTGAGEHESVVALRDLVADKEKSLE